MKKILFLFSMFSAPELFSQEIIPNPFAKIGIYEEVTTIPNHSAFYNDNDKLELNGLVYDRTTGKVVEVKKYFQDTLMLKRIGQIKITDGLTCEEEEVDIDTTEFYTYNANGVSRWLSVDPVVQPYASPYTSFGDSPIYITDPDGNIIIPFMNKSFKNEYNASVKKLSTGQIFSQVYSQLQKSTTIFVYESANLNPIPSTDVLGGYFSPTPIKNPYLVNEAHSVKLDQNVGYTKGVVFEESYHAGEYLFNKQNNIKTTTYQTEVEERVAKAFEFGEKINDNVVTEFYRENKSYFEKLRNGETITKKEESTFRSNTVSYFKNNKTFQSQYSKQAKADNNSYKGDTKYFDSLVNKKVEK